MKSYFEKHNSYPPFLSKPLLLKDVIVVIPAYNEPSILATLDSIQLSRNFNFNFEIIIVINHSDLAKASIITANKRLLLEIESYQKENGFVTEIQIIKAFNLPNKKAGVGLARKIGMDEAARRLKPEGVIVCLDADSTVADNYLSELYSFFKERPKLSGASIHFEHPYAELEDTDQRSSIVQYELHLRYFIAMQRNIQLPYAYQTVGSSMAVRNSAYQKFGGMNVRKAGEDFYFLHKFIKNGVFGEIKNTTVYPSCRVSDRVPFGTGKAVGDMLFAQVSHYETYNPKSFNTIYEFISWALKSGHSDEYNGILKPFLLSQKYLERLEEIKNNTASLQAFTARFYRWFDAFLLMKALHYLRDKHFSNIKVLEAVNETNEILLKDEETALEYYRKQDLELSR